MGPVTLLRALAVALILGGCGTAGVSTPMGSSERGVLAIEGVLVQPDDRTLVVTVLSGTHTNLHPSHPCWEGFRPEIATTATEVVITIHHLAPSNPVYPEGHDESTYACNAAGQMSNVEVVLPEPLAGRSVIDATDGTVPQVVSLGAVLEPTWLPEGMIAGQADGADGVWVQRWYGGEGGPNAFVWLFQNPDPAVAASFPRATDTLLDRPTIRGVPATLVQQTGAPFWTLAWNEGGTSLVLQTGPNLGTDGGIPTDQLIAIAVSLA